ncbi:hypothetical protein B566_EDAN007011 [Ephemera danica]|nr:hypothetical protein B566_EDAN007011 [Ephemera danica]
MKMLSEMLLFVALGVSCTTLNEDLILGHLRRSESDQVVLNSWYEYAWTSGCYGKIHGDKYMWLGTGNPVSYFNWAGGEPSDRGRDGFCILLSNRSPVWYDSDFTGALRFVCEL